MGMLDRYRRKGGFLQLLKLLEGCAPAKQAQLLDVIQKEDADWASLLKKKMLSLEIIFNWKAETLAEFTHLLPPKTLAYAVKKLGPDALQKAITCFAHTKKREIEDIFSSSSPSPGEMLAATGKIIEKVRELTDNGTLKFERFAPELTLDDEAA
ncbi:MAG: FliG C-terminal domain-containing protein [Pseudomonadota bacterium]|nr:FliG C-terminal domain-containing protein [Pseudomonadota bacterium]